jgi:hypothetical protein
LYAIRFIQRKGAKAMKCHNMPLALIASLLIASLLSGCGSISSALFPTATPYPTYTPWPTLTPYATLTPYSTLTPYPTYTPLPPTATPTVPGTGEWVKGHFWSIKVASVQTATDLDGKRPSEDVFVVVEVDWKANDLAEKHPISGIDFELVDAKGKQYGIAGMIYEPVTFESYGSGAKFQKGKWVNTRASGTAKDTARLVFDVPSSATGLKLWLQDLPLIDLGLVLP